MTIKLALSTRQRLVLELIERDFHGEMPATTKSYRYIARELAIAEAGPVVTCLRSLRHYGRLRSEGPSMAYPEKWVVVTVAADQQHEHI